MIVLLFKRDCEEFSASKKTHKIVFCGNGAEILDLFTMSALFITEAMKAGAEFGD